MGDRRFDKAVLLRAAILALPVVASRAWAVTTFQFTGATGGNWSTSANWTPAGPPTAGNIANVTNIAAPGGGFRMNFDSVYNLSTQLSSAAIDSTTAYPVIINQTAASSAMYVTTELIGDAGVGTWNQSAGTNSTTVAYIGGNAGSTGAYNLSGGTVTATSAYIGLSGIGTVTQHGGTSSLGIYNYNSFAGYGTGSSGTITLDESVAPSSMTTGYFYLGYSGTGAFNQAGGQFQATQMTLGFNQGSNGVVNLSGGGMNASSVTIGGSGNGTFNQTGGTFTASSYVQVGLSNGSYGTLTVNGGAFNSSGNMIIGYSGVGAMYLRGGTGTAANLFIGYTTGGSGYFSNTGGTMNVPGFINVGSTGSASGQLSVSAGTLTAGGTLTVVNNGNSVVYLSGGTLDVTTLNTNGNPSNFNWTGGTLGITAGGLSIDSTLSAPLGASVSLNALQTLNINGTLTNNGTLTLAGGTAAPTSVTNNGLITGNGAINVTGAFNNAGAISVPSGVLSVTGAITQPNSGSTTLGLGASLRFNGFGLFNDGQLNLNGGRIYGTVGNTLEQVTNYLDGTINGPGTFSVPVVNNGLITDSTGTLTMPGMNNSGFVILNGVSAVIASPGTITNLSVIQGHGRVSAAITNGGTIEATGGTLAFSGSINNTSPNGLLRAGAGAELLFSPTVFPNNNDVISLTGGTLDTSGGTLGNLGQITGYGTISTGGLVNYAGFTLTGGTSTVNGPVTNTGGSTMNIKYQPAVFTGLVTNFGTIKTTGTTVTYAGGANNSGSYISDPSDNLFQGNLNNAGSISGGSGDRFFLSAGTFNNTGNFNNGGTLVSADGTTNGGTFVQTGPQNWSAGSTFTNTVGATATFGSDTGAAGPNLSVQANGGTVTFTSTQHLAGLTVAAGSTVTVTSGPARSVIVTPTMADSGTIDLSVGDLDLSGATLAAVTALIRQGHLASSTAAADSRHLTAVGVIENNQSGTALYSISRPFDGVIPGPGDVLAKYTYFGDANFDGKVDGSDYALVDSGFSTPSKTGWYNGDFNYDGVVDGSDYTLLDNAFNNQLTALSPTALTATAAAETSAVPEPASIAIGVLITAGFAGRRSRRIVAKRHPL